MSQKKSIYWLCFEEHLRVFELHMQLGTSGYQVQTFRDVNAMVQKISEVRSPIIVITENGAHKQLSEAIKILSHLPEAQGSRFILASTGRYPDLAGLAASCAFRDILPLDLETKQWMNRFAYATSRQAINFPVPTPQISTAGIAAVSVPARVVWISEDKILLESKLQGLVRHQASIVGAFAETLGLKSLSVETLEYRQKHLNYRFSGATLLRWTAPQSQRDRVRLALQQLRQQAANKPKHKVYLAIQDKQLRSEALHKLEQESFEVKMPLQKSNLIEEPAFFGPDIVIIEDSLCIGANQETFVKMIDQLDRDVPVLIVGREISHPPAQAADNSGITILAKLPEHLASYIHHEIHQHRQGDKSSSGPDAIHVPADHPASYCEIRLPARITMMHPSAISLRIPVPISPFALIRIESPSLRSAVGHYPFAKVVECYEHPKHIKSNFQIQVDAHFSNIDAAGRQKIAESLIKAVQERLSQDTGAATDHGLSQAAPLDPQEKPLEIQSRSLNPQPLRSRASAVALSDLESEEDQASYNTAVAEGFFSRFTWALYEGIYLLFTQKIVKQFLIFIAFLILFLGGMYFVAKYADRHYEKSGRQYTEPVRRIFEKNLR